MLIDKFKYLPDVIIHYILEYTNIIRYRHGKYIDRLKITDEHKCIIEKIPALIYTYDNIYTIIKCGKIYFKITYYFYSNTLIIYKYNPDTFHVKTEYILDKNNKWRQLVYYIM